MTEINFDEKRNNIFKVIKIHTKRTFTIEANTAAMGKYTTGGFIT